MIFHFFGVFIIIFLKIFPAHVPKGGIFPVISQFWLSSNRFSRFFHDFFRKSRNITKYQFLLNQPFLASNQDKKLVLRAGLEPTTLCLEGRCSIQLSYRSTFCCCPVSRLLPRTESVATARNRPAGAGLRQSVDEHIHAGPLHDNGSRATYRRREKRQQTIF